jgi:hypothetical protein
MDECKIRRVARELLNDADLTEATLAIIEAGSLGLTSSGTPTNERKPDIETIGPCVVAPQDLEDVQRVVYYEFVKSFAAQLQKHGINFQTPQILRRTEEGDDVELAQLFARKGFSMGAWGELAFDNDSANDWAYGLDEIDDLSLVESAFDELEEVGGEYLDQDIACNALAACEVLARLQGNPGYKNAYTEKVDQWVAAHKLRPTSELLKRASAAIDRIIADNSELRDLWDETDDAEKWRTALADLRLRLRA